MAFFSLRFQAKTWYKTQRYNPSERSRAHLSRSFPLPAWATNMPLAYLLNASRLTQGRLESLASILKLMTLLQISHRFFDELAEDGIGPCEPFAGEVLRIVDVHTLVHEIGIRVDGRKRVGQIPDFPGLLAGQALNTQGNRPDVVRRGVRAADALRGGSFIVIDI